MARRPTLKAPPPRRSGISSLPHRYASSGIRETRSTKLPAPNLRSRRITTIEERRRMKMARFNKRGKDQFTRQKIRDLEVKERLGLDDSVEGRVGAGDASRSFFVAPEGVGSPQDAPRVSDRLDLRLQQEISNARRDFANFRRLGRGLSPISRLIAILDQIPVFPLLPDPGSQSAPATLRSPEIWDAPDVIYPTPL